jgi:ribosomal subunit interface protein
MKIDIVTKNMDLTPAIESYVREKIGSVEKLLDPNDTVAMAQVEVGQTTKRHQSGEIFRAEVNLTFSHGFLRAESVKDNLYAAIDDAKDDLMRELRKDKNKHESLMRKGAAKIKNMLRFGKEE